MGVEVKKTRKCSQRHLAWAFKKHSNLKNQSKSNHRNVHAKRHVPDRVQVKNLYLQFDAIDVQHPVHVHMFRMSGNVKKFNKFQPRATLFPMAMVGKAQKSLNKQ